MKLDLNKFEGQLPYSSEIFGVYSAMIGWKSKRIERRLFSTPSYVRKLKPLINRYDIVGEINADNYEDCKIKASYKKVKQPFDNSSSIILSSLVGIVLDRNPSDRPVTNLEIGEAIFNYLEKISNQGIDGLRNSISIKIEDIFTSTCLELNFPFESPYEGQREYILDNYAQRLTWELRMLELLNDLAKAKEKEKILEIVNEELLFKQNNNERRLDKINKVLGITTAYFDPKEDLKDITLSPIGS